MKQRQENRFVKQMVRMFRCDEARITRPMDRMFLILGWKRSTRKDAGQWLKNGKPFHFTYLREQVIASGRTYKALLESAKKYKQLESTT